MVDKNEKLSLALIGCAFFILGIDLFASYFGKGNILVNCVGGGWLLGSIIIGGQSITRVRKNYNTQAAFGLLAVITLFISTVMHN